MLYICLNKKNYFYSLLDIVQYYFKFTIVAIVGGSSPAHHLVEEGGPVEEREKSLGEAVQAIKDIATSLKELLVPAQDQLGKVGSLMTEAVKMAEIMRKTSENNLKAAEVQLKIKQVNNFELLGQKNLEDSNLKRKNPYQNISSNKNIKIPRLDEALLEAIASSHLSEENSFNENEEKEADNSNRKILEQEIISLNKLNVKREYKLTQKSNFDIWMDHLKTDLTS